MSIRLTSVEQTLRQLLLDVAAYINPSKPSELRFTGGWVRDKLLGVDSHDIDVAINDMTGYQFGLRMKEYLEDAAKAQKYGIGGLSKGKDASQNKVGGLHKIEANPEKSKHLETVTTKIFGLDVDLVNLRKETYTQDSRNPQMEFGTPEEDALRRDATINAMFYNLQSEEVEDLTGKGMNDLKCHVIRTPLEPLQTFTDDPLRILRLIRFASKYEYEIDESAQQAMQDSRVREALKLKITRERVGVEVDKMLRGPHPLTAVTLIDRLGLYETVFVDPTRKQHYEPEVDSWHVTYGFADKLINGTHTQLKELLLTNSDDTYAAWLLSTIVPYIDAPIVDGEAKGKRQLPLATEVIKEGIKASNRPPVKAWDLITASVFNYQSIRDVKDRLLRHQRLAKNLTSADDDPSARDTLGMAIRSWGSSWRLQVIFALFTEVTLNPQPERNFASEYQKFLNHIHSLDLQDVCAEKSILDGTQLAKALNVRPGAWMAPALDVIMAWQLRHPSAADTTSALDAVRNSGTIPSSSSTNGSSPPTTTTTSAAAKGDEPTGELLRRLIRHFLSLTIRPLFSKTRSQHDDRTTRQGRQRQANLLTGERRRNLSAGDDEAERKPWRSEKNAYALDLLGWCVRSLDAKATEEFWPLLIPPLLGVLDDTDVRFKVRGCEFLSDLFRATSPELLKRTGLAPVFNDALTPCLYYLPSLTPEHESIALLDAAYTALLHLHTIRFPSTSTSTSTSTPTSSSSSSSSSTTPRLPPSPTDPSTQNLSTLLHTHILPTITHVTTSNPLIIPTLLRHLNSIIHRLDRNAIIHMQYLIPVLLQILDRPFAASLPGIEDRSVLSGLLGLVGCGAGGLMHLIAVGWPRVGRWEGEVVKGVVACWVQVVATGEEEGGGSSGDCDDNDESTAAGKESDDTLVREAKTELAKVIAMLVRVEAKTAQAREDGVNFELPEERDDGQSERGQIMGTLDELVEWDPRITGLRTLVGELLETDQTGPREGSGTMDCEICREARDSRSTV
ncbi:MAG: CCA tRNA nucleotidyltransferase, mitochondrial [Chrysothrix sp. TS-e1954]|nr:MAG: CCA tRNA nucleotidyltransferase, mitochondrial [Chrysothrix sp. TS-e1954]